MWHRRFCIDFSSQAIDLARTRASVQKYPVTFHVADAQRLPFENNSFDLLFSCECLEHIPEPSQSLAEFYRVLRPSGKILLTTENYSNAMLLSWIVCWYRRKPFDSGAGVQPIEHFFLFWRVKRMFEQAGFSVERIVGSHHVFLMLPRFDPHTFVVEYFRSPGVARLLRLFARHMTFAAAKR